VNIVDALSFLVMLETLVALCFCCGRGLRSCRHTERLYSSILRAMITMSRGLVSLGPSMIQ
jgi:hypothetical protein